MQLRLVTASVAVAAAIGSNRASLPHGGAACSSDWDCSLGGICRSGGVCACDAWFTGASCDLLNLVAPTPEEFSSWGLQLPGYSTWGGHAALDPASGRWHGYFSLMCNHGPLDDWTTFSSIAHATALNVTGPYQFVELIDVPYATNAMYVPPPPGGGLHMVWRIGDASGDNPGIWSPCYVAPSASADADTSGTQRRQRSHSRVAFVPPSSPGGVEVNTTFVQTSPALAGPWTEWGSVSVNLTGSWASGTSNPAPLILSNGTTLLYHSAQTCPPGWGLAPSCIGLARGATWQGPFTEATALPITRPEGEDPFVFRDPRGNYHL